ncbi:uncharacterized protein LOC127873462 [Dreissena polymorpha]|uniref:uncharacterized protein LOC127873462 n=1 Tax=Dreissena polymorpha TaxID=45954 RepID=UPI00226493AF|nr:uncharacterized protein LOC127873462 [Dreissena polymorpha]
MSIMIGLVVFAVVISTVTVFFFIRGVRRRIRRNAILDPIKGFRTNSSQQSDIRMESEHQSGNDSVHASNIETNANFEANINIYSNLVASFSRPVAQTAEQNELVYADKSGQVKSSQHFIKETEASGPKYISCNVQEVV